jgi:hypothetical protein
MTETVDANHFQTYLDGVTQGEIEHFPELATGDDITGIDRQGTMILHIWDNLHPLLYVERKFICGGTTKEVNESEKEKIRTRNLAKILGLSGSELPGVFQRGVPEGQLRTRLERTFACVNLFMRIFEDPIERNRNLTFPRPELRGKSAIDSLFAGNVDQVLYFAAMSARHLDVLG